MATIGEQFKAARGARGMTVAEAAEVTRIKPTHIEAMERDDFRVMASPVYARGFIKLYAEVLDLDPKPLLEAYAEAHAPALRLPMEADAQGRVRPRARHQGGTKGPSVFARLAEAWRARLGGVDMADARRVAFVAAAALFAVLLLLGGVRLLRARPERTERQAPHVAADFPRLEPPPDPFVDSDAFGFAPEPAR